MIDVRELPAVEPRAETGPTKFGDDWTGVFIRGDHAAYYALHVRRLLGWESRSSSRGVVEDLITLLEASDERGRAR